LDLNILEPEYTEEEEIWLEFLLPGRTKKILKCSQGMPYIDFIDESILGNFFFNLEYENKQKK